MRQITPSNRRVTLRMTEEEFQLILRCATRDGMGFAEYMRHMTLTAAYAEDYTAKLADTDPAAFAALGEKFNALVTRLEGGAVNEND